LSIGENRRQQVGEERHAPASIIGQENLSKAQTGIVYYEVISKLSGLILAEDIDT
jgi:hypothetical protein